MLSSRSMMHRLTGLALAAIVAGTVLSCIKYYTREFMSLGAPTKRGALVVTPNLTAFSGSHRVDLVRDTIFYLTVYVENTQFKPGMPCEQTDSSMIVDSATLEHRFLSRPRMFQVVQRKRDPYYCWTTRVLLEDPNVPIPKAVDTVRLEVFCTADPFGPDRLPVVYQYIMIRHEKSDWFLPLD